MQPYSRYHEQDSRTACIKSDKMDMNEVVEPVRDVIFISKGTPQDDEFATWLGPRLEASGYKVFADILSLKAGERWRKTITDTLYNNAVKMLLCCSDTTLSKNGVQEEIGIAESLAKSLDDPKFIIPLRLKEYKKIFGIGELQWINFENQWARGLTDLLEQLDGMSGIPKQEQVTINPNWELYKRRQAVQIENAPEPLTSNWVRIASLPDKISYYVPSGAISLAMMLTTARRCEFPIEPFRRGFWTFAPPETVSQTFEHIGKFKVEHEVETSDFLNYGFYNIGLASREASNMIVSILRKAWNGYCRAKQLRERFYSNDSGFHISENQLELGKRLPWGRQGERRSSMLRNTIKGSVWEYGVTAYPSLWPYPHFRVKPRVLFSELKDEKAGEVFDDDRKQHRLRRSNCKGWRNKRWHGLLMAFFELLSDDREYIDLPLGGQQHVRIDAMPLMFTSPVTTFLPDEQDDNFEDIDSNILGVDVPLEDTE